MWPETEIMEYKDQYLLPVACSENENTLFTSYSSVAIYKDDTSVYRAHSFIYIPDFPRAPASHTHWRKGSKEEQTTALWKQSSKVKLLFIRFYNHSWPL